MKRTSAFGWVLCVVAVLALAACGGGSGGKPTTTRSTTPVHRIPKIGPVALSVGALKTQANMLHHPVYWAGPMSGDQYEFTRTTTGRLFVRYLPKAVKVGVKSGNYLVVATYFVPSAYHALKKAAKGKGESGSDGRLVLVRPNDPNSVLVAWPNVQYQVEIYDPTPATAKRTALSAKLQPVH